MLLLEGGGSSHVDVSGLNINGFTQVAGGVGCVPLPSGAPPVSLPPPPVEGGGS